MNIFVTSTAPFMCARSLDSRRLVKMVLETAQLISTATLSEVLGVESPDLIYAPAYQDHPVTRWVSASRRNASWTRQLLLSLGHEYYLRYRKRHSSMQVFDATFDLESPMHPESFCDCSGQYEDPRTEVIDRYRACLTAKWRADVEKGFWPVWGEDGPPTWLEYELWSAPAQKAWLAERTAAICEPA